jgi:hypothetical protein
MTTRLTVDRFEADTAVLIAEAGDALELPRVFLPVGALAGDCVILTVVVDWARTERLKGETRDVRDDLRRRDPGGDLTL